MGCSSQKDENQSEQIILRSKLKERVLKLIKNNPLYHISTKDFDKFISEQETKINTTKISKLTEKIISEFFDEDESIIIISIFQNIAYFASKKFKSIFRKGKDINTHLLYFLYFFLTENQNGRDDLLLNKLLDLFYKIGEKDEDKIKFQSGKFSFLLLNLIQFCSYIFVYFFCGPGILELSGNFRNYEIENVFSNREKEKKFEFKTIDKFVDNYLNLMNEQIKPEIVNTIILTDVLQPISDYILDNDDEKYFIIDVNMLKEILIILVHKMNHNYYLELFFKTEK